MGVQILSGRFQDGSAAIPAKTYILNPTLGQYRIGSNNEGFSAGGTLRWDYDTTRLKLSTTYQLQAGSNVLIGSVADKLNAAHLAIASQAIGDMLYADSTTSFARLAAVAAGQVLASGGVATAPAWSASPTLTSLTLTGAMLASDGSSTAGGFAFAAETTLGFARNSAGTVDLIGGTLRIRASGAGISFLTDNASDIGASGANRPRTGYYATALVVGTNPASTGAVRLANAGQIVARNAANTGDGTLLYLDGSNVVQMPQDSLVLGSSAPIVRWGGTSASFPALKRDTIFVQLRLADDTGVTGAVTASLPAGAAGRDGNIGFDTTLNAFVYYVGGSRFKLVGTSF